MPRPAAKPKRPRPLPTGLAEEERPFVHDEIMRGIPARKVQRLIAHGALDAKQVHRIIPARTFNRRVANNESLKPAEADGVARLMRVAALAKRIFRDEDFSREFLRLPNPALGNRIPNDLAETEAGARDVETILWRIAYGVYT